MTTETTHPVATAYLERLRRAARELAPGRRDELIADIDAHLAAAIPVGASEAEARTVIDRLGQPEEILAEELASPVPPGDGTGGREWAAIILLAFGGFLAGLGWILGVILLWSSPAWTTPQKWLGTLIVPGGLATGCVALLLYAGGSGQTCSGPAFPGGSPHCVGGASTATLIVFGVSLAVALLAPISTSIYLARSARPARGLSP